MVLATLLLTLVAGSAALAQPFHQPTIDGTVTADGDDWSPVDRVVNDSHDDGGPPRYVRSLWCTWDETSLYLGLLYQDYYPIDSLSVYIDLDRGVGPNAADGLDILSGPYTLPDDHGFELLLGRPANLVDPEVYEQVPDVYLVTDANGAVVSLNDEITTAQTAGSAPAKSTRFGTWNRAEFALPWASLYPDEAGTVPPYAVIKAVALINDGQTNVAVDCAPDNAGLDGSTGTILLSNLHASVIDADGDGQPDPADATLSGTVILPDDPGTGALTVTAELVDWAGRDLGEPVAVTTTADGERAWTLSRLPAGRYEVTYEIAGYFPATTTIDVATSEQVTDVDETLAAATGIRGTISFASGPGKAGVVSVEQGGETLYSTSFTSAGGTYVLWVLESGTYTVKATADTYLPFEAEVTVTAGQDVTGFDIALQRQTRIAGSVTMAAPPYADGMVYFHTLAGDSLGAAGFTDGSGTFEFFTPTGGDFVLTVDDYIPDIYVPLSMPITVTTGVDVTGLVLAPQLAARVSGTVTFEGPAAAGRLALFDNESTVPRDTLDFDTDGTPFAYYLAPGDYDLFLTADGYLPQEVSFTVTAEDLDLGPQELIAIRATHLELIDDNGDEIDAKITTVSIPDEDKWVVTRVNLAARDDEGREDLHDLAGNLSNFRLSALKMDDLSPPRGNVLFQQSDDETDTTSTVSFVDGRATFWTTNDAVEVLRVYLAQPNKDPIAGRIIVAFQDPQPTTVVISAVDTVLTADGEDQITVRAQLYDSADNPALVPNIGIGFAVSSESSGEGKFEVATVLTNADGQAEAVLTATGAGTLQLTCVVTVNNQTLDVNANELGSGEDLLAITALPGPTAGWELSVPSSLSDLVSPVTVTAQLVDALGNATRDSGHEITFTVDPAGLGSFDPATAVSDTNGRAESVFTPTGNAGVVTLSGSGALPGDETGLRLRDVFVVTDPVWYNEPRTRQTFEPTDLTALVVDNTADELLLDIPFSSNWNGLQLHVIFETGFDAAGAPSDPFQQPVNYGHALKPEYALTCKYSANDYGDFRRWNGSGWEWWDPDSETYGGSGNVLGAWTTKTGDSFQIEMPWAPFGGRPDSLRFEVYLTQEDGVKRSAFDSVPQDSTLNLDFDYENPEEGDWDSAEATVTLEAWSDVYVVKTDFPTPPTVDNLVATPSALNAGEPFTIRATVSPAGDGIGDVLADLSSVGAGELVRMHDDGQSSHGDEIAGDGIYSARAVVSPGSPGGEMDLIVNAYEASNSAYSAGSVAVDITAIIEPILQVADPEGDDHGANQPDEAQLYITYPTNSAFVAGAFDLLGLTVYETVATVSGQQIDMIAFEIAMGDFPDPADPGTADWSPLYADMNIQKVDILIDSAPGGATASLPNRQAAFQPWDAWDYAIIIDGWYKGVIPSLGQNTADSWRENVLNADKDILLVGNPDMDIVTAFVSKSSLGDPTTEDILGWDIAVCMLSHDGDADFGGVRWVNESRSEWNPGGGHREDRDSNIIDLLLVPGSGHSAGLPQEDILNYNSVGALERLAAGETPVAIEMSAFEDTGPPVIDIGNDGAVVTQVEPITGAPLAMSVSIVDDYRVDGATFRYRSTSYTEEGWSRQAAMGSLADNLWVVDILPSWLDSNLVYSPVDSNRYLEFEITATDHLGKESTCPVTTLQISPNARCRLRSSTLEAEDVSLLQTDGSVLTVPENLRPLLVETHLAEAWQGAAVAADTMGAAVELQWDICAADEAIWTAQTVPPARPLGVFRDVYLATVDTLGGVLDYTDRLPNVVELALHYPQAWVPTGADENKIAVYEYKDASDRWVLLGGNVSPTGNNVTVSLNRTGTFGLFHAESLEYDSSEVISGILISPNPFSPNGDGLYDETTISFYLNQEATVTVEIYNIDGERQRVLTQTYPYSGSELDNRTPRRVAGLVWDGLDFNRDPVPYGIYIVRVITTYNQSGGTRSIRSNHSLAVIR